MNFFVLFIPFLVFKNPNSNSPFCYFILIYNIVIFFFNYGCYYNIFFSSVYSLLIIKFAIIVFFHMLLQHFSKAVLIFLIILYYNLLILFADIAQLVEQRIRNPEVSSSILLFRHQN